MKDFRIALVQQESPVRKKADNLDATVRWARKAAARGAALVCFPELNITGHAGHPSMVEGAECVPGGDAERGLRELAGELGVYIVAGITEADGACHYNTQFIVGPEGYVGKQRKVHLSGDEYFYFRGGTDLPVFDLAIGRVGIAICYDNNVPEVPRVLAVKGLELLLAPHACRCGKWPKSPSDRRKRVADTRERWKRVQGMRAYDNGFYVAVCNAVGRSAYGIRGVEANHAGVCMLIGPDGEVRAESRNATIREEMLVADVDHEAVAARRRGACFNLNIRKPEAFGALSEPTG